VCLTLDEGLDFCASAASAVPTPQRGGTAGEPCEDLLEVHGAISGLLPGLGIELLGSIFGTGENLGVHHVEDDVGRE
jgi:hypothetical protein